LQIAGPLSVEANFYTRHVSAPIHCITANDRPDHDIPARGTNLVSRPYFVIYYQLVADFGDQAPPAIGYTIAA